jgi:nucleoside-diphosphate-sugar epimerase
MRRPVVLITGANGEIGHGLINRLADEGSRAIVTLDVAPLEPSLRARVQREVTASILEKAALERILSEFEVDLVFHLAALLSTRAEFSPVAAHDVNVEGTLNLLEFAQREGESHGRPVVFLYPSSIAAYGLPSLEAKIAAGRVREDDWAHPSTMYGCNKLYCEQLGRYYARHYKQLSADARSGRVDFRAVRFPGLISAVTVPSGGTSDYAPEMVHAAARGAPYACFARPDAKIPFMAMPDGVDALLALAAAPRDRLTQTAYNVAAFARTADEIRGEVVRAFPSADITFNVDQKRQGIQKFIGHVPWDHQPLFATLVDQVGQQLGEPDAVIVFDPDRDRFYRYCHLSYVKMSSGDLVAAGERLGDVGHSGLNASQAGHGRHLHFETNEYSDGQVRALGYQRLRTMLRGWRSSSSPGDGSGGLQAKPRSARGRSNR